MGKKWMTSKPSDVAPGTVTGHFVSRKQERQKAKKLKKLQNVAFAKHQPIEKVISESLHMAEAKKKRKKKKTRADRRAAKETEEKREVFAMEEDDSGEESEEAEEDRRRIADARRIAQEDYNDYGSDEDITYEQYLKEVEEQKAASITDEDRAQMDDIDVARYGKLLGLNKKKSKSMPKMFSEDGLDVLLEFCDSEKRDELVDNDESMTMLGEDMIEDEEDDEEEEEKEDEDEFDLSENEVDEMSDGDESMTEVEIDDEEEGEEAMNEEIEEEQEGEEEEKIEEEPVEVKEDIYGRKVNKKTGELIAFDPAGARKKLEELDARGGNDEEKAKINKAITGLINRLSESTLIKSKQSFAELWATSSKNDVKSCLSRLIWNAVSTPYRLQDQMISTYAFFLAVLHGTVSSEISCYFVEKFIVDFVTELDRSSFNEEKAMENRCVLFTLFVTFRIVKSALILDLIRKLRQNLNIDKLQLILVLCTYSHKVMKRQCWVQFVNEITETETTFQAAVFSGLPRAKFMAEKLASLKKTPPTDVDFTVIEHQVQLYHGIMKKERKPDSDRELAMTLEDLLAAEERGRWWVVGSAFRLPTEPVEDVPGTSVDSATKSHAFSADILALAVKAKMNTQVRKNIFCTIASADDEDEAFERLCRLALKGQQEREHIHVLMVMALKEKNFNPFYPALMARFCQYDRRFTLTTQYAIWDRLRELSSMKPKAWSHLAGIIHYLLSHQVLPITIFKAVEWGMLQSSVSTVLRRVFVLLADAPVSKLQRIFLPVLSPDKNPLLTEGLRLFLQINFKNNKTYQRVEEWFSGQR